MAKVIQIRVWHVLLALVALIVFRCANDIKGEKGDAGQDATATALVSLKRPSFYSAETTKVVVPATTARPAEVLINGTVYTNTADVVCDLSGTGTGRGKLVGGTLDSGTLYFLYAIPAETGSTFDLVASTYPPDTGPASPFTSWSYLGGFSTVNNHAEISPFVSSRGTIHFEYAIQDDEHESSTVASGVSRKIHVPDFAKFAQIEAYIGSLGLGSSVEGLVTGSPPDRDTTPAGLYVGRFADAQMDFNTGNVSLISPQTIYIRVTGDGALFARVVGWTEDPTEWP